MIAALLAATVTAAPSASPTPQEIFDKAFTRLATYPVAPYAVEIATRYEQMTSPYPEREGRREFVMRYTFSSSNQSENFTTYPTTGTALPPALIDRLAYGPFVWSIRRGNGFASPPPGNSTLPDVPQPLKTIARVVAYAPPSYSIDLAPDEAIDGHECYHLRLRPLSDPDRHNLRELWIDTSTYDLWKARFDGTYRPVPMELSSATTFTSIFAPAGKYWVVSRQHWTWTDVRNSVLFDINIEINKIVFPATLPDYLFDQIEYDKRQRAGDPDPLDAILNGS